MKNELKILILEDDVVDAKIIIRYLQEKQLAFEHSVCDSPEQYRKLLNEHSWDVILSDYEMPNFTALDALHILQNKMMDIPFVIISGAISDELAIQAMAEGAHDYILKNNIARLFVVIKRELREAAIRREARENFALLQKSEKKYRDIITLAPIGFFQTNRTGNILTANNSLAQMLDYEDDNYLVNNVEMPEIYYRPSDREKLLTKFDDDNLTINNVEIVFRKKNGSPIFVLLTSQAIRDAENKIIYFNGFVMNITELKLTEKQMKLNQHRLELATESSQAGIWDLHLKKNILHFDERMFMIHAISPHTFDRTYEGWLKLIHPEDVNKLHQELHEAINGEKTYNGHYRIVRPDGEIRYIEAHSKITNDNRGKPIHLVMMNIDITDKLARENRLAKELEEKNLLLRELYHRTKNNMQNIVSILNMQAGHSTDESLKYNYREVISKIWSMSLVHQKLYESKDYSRIALKGYIEHFISRLFRSYQISRDDIELELDLKEVFITAETAIPLGLVLTELISNAFKHAFPKTKKGKITIKLYERNEEINLEVSDNGVGLKSDLNLKDLETVGLRNVFNLIEYQLRGRINFSSENGLHWHVIINEKTKAKIEKR
jgi:two-component system sensor kinase